MLIEISASTILGYLKLGVFVTVVIVGIIVFFTIRSKVRGVSRQLFGTDSISEGINRYADIAAETPKSVSSMTSIMEPQIARDFPEFSWPQFRDKAENMLLAALGAISAGEEAISVEASDEIRKMISNRVVANRRERIKENYSQIKIHQTEIANYQKGSGKCVITLQSAIEYYYYKEQDGRIIAGTKERKTQTKYNTEIMYIQDVEKLKDKNAVGTTCPNCGAPVSNLGAKFCEYCGSHVIPVNIKVWSLHNFYEVDYNRTY